MEKTRRTHVQGGNLDQTDNGVAGSAYLLRAARRSSGCTRATFAPNCSEVAFRPSNTGSQHRRLSEDGFVPTVLVNAFRRMKLLGASIHGKQGPARKTLNTEGFLAEIHTDRIGVPAPFPASLPLQPPRSKSGSRGPFRSRDPSYFPRRNPSPAPPARHRRQPTAASKRAISRKTRHSTPKAALQSSFFARLDRIVQFRP